MTPPIILATSDLHGQLPDPREIPECDIFIIAGDVCPMTDHSSGYQARWLRKVFAPWLEALPARDVVGIAGNHDFTMQKEPPVPNELPWHYLRDNGITLHDLRFWGIPWVPNLIGWAFYANKKTLACYYNGIPRDTDIVISHGPPYGLGDCSLMGNIHCGARQANDMLGRVRPKAFINGHIHEGYGHYRFRPQHGNPIDVYNVSYLDENYRTRPLAQPIVEIKVDGEDQTDAEREVRSEDTDHGRSSESTP